MPDINFSLLAKVSQFSIVQSTTTGTTTFVACHCLHPMTLSAMEVLVCKLLQYNHGQSFGDTQYHIVGSYPPIHPYCIILHGSLHATYYTIYLTTIYSCAAIFSTIKSVPLFSTPSYYTSKPSHHKCCTSMHDSCNV